MTDIFQQILIILAVVIGGGSIAYFYFSADIFTNILKRPLKMISVGMLSIDIGVALIGFIAYESASGVKIDFFGIPLSTCFYVLYFFGCIAVIFGSRAFTRQPK